MLLTSSTHTSLIFRSGHIQTILAGMKKMAPASTTHERITTPDDDFLDLYWRLNESSSLVVLCHGLEGSAESAHIVSMSHACSTVGFDVLTWNYRGCGHEINRAPVMYHAGATDDLDTVLSHALAKSSYESILVIGFSLGGNLGLLYASESRSTRRKLAGVVAISAPIDLAGCGELLQRGIPRYYAKHFLKSLRQKIRLKAVQYPKQYDLGLLDKVNTIADFDEHYVAPRHGFLDARDYWKKCSSLKRLANITTPCLLINAQDDPLLSASCFPEEDELSESILVRYPSFGGHCGFMTSFTAQQTWAERAALGFCVAQTI